MRAEIKEVLTPEQRARFDANVTAQQRKADDLDRRLGSPAGTPGAVDPPADSAS
jgi:hypothetical protein